MGWYHKWFGTPYYKLLYGHRSTDEAAQFLDALILKLGLVPPMRVIDVGCGTGRHSKYMASKGFDVVGMDVVPENIELARQENLPNLQFIEHDMRLSFPPQAQEAKLALNLFTSFGYFESPQDDEATLENVCNALVSGGKLVLDFMNAGQVANTLVQNETILRGDVKFTIRRTLIDDSVVKNIDVYDNGNVAHYAEKVRLLDLPAFEALFKGAGLHLEETYGDYTLTSPPNGDSPRLIMVALKK